METNDEIPWGAHHFARTSPLTSWKDVCLQTFQEIENKVVDLIGTTSALIFKDYQGFGLVSDAQYILRKY